MPKDFKIKKFSIGDLVVQELKNTSITPNKTYRRNGIIVEIGRTTSVIEWTNNIEKNETRFLTLFNTTLRKMIMDGHLQHYPVQKST